MVTDVRRHVVPGEAVDVGVEAFEDRLNPVEFDVFTEPEDAGLCVQRGPPLPEMRKARVLI